MLLHSGFADHSHNRFDILVAQPRVTLTTQAPARQSKVTASPLSLRRIRSPCCSSSWRRKAGSRRLTRICRFRAAPGLFGYDLGRRVETLPQLAEADLALPDMAVGIYDWALIADHQLQTLTLLSYGDVEQRWRWLTSQTAPTERPFTLLSGWRANMSRRQYGEKFQRIQHYLRSGDCYQINLAQRFSADYQGMNGRRFAD
ncbi:hypothetical protein M5585_14150 [Serratia ureilytica]